MRLSPLNCGSQGSSFNLNHLSTFYSKRQTNYITPDDSQFQVLALVTLRLTKIISFSYQSLCYAYAALNRNSGLQLTMNIKIRIMLFCLSAVLTVVDIGSDIYVATEHYDQFINGTYSLDNVFDYQEDSKTLDRLEKFMKNQKTHLIMLNRSSEFVTENYYELVNHSESNNPSLFTFLHHEKSLHLVNSSSFIDTVFQSLPVPFSQWVFDRYHCQDVPQINNLKSFNVRQYDTFFNLTNTASSMAQRYKELVDLPNSGPVIQDFHNAIVEIANSSVVFQQYNKILHFVDLFSLYCGKTPNDVKEEMNHFRSFQTIFHIDWYHAFRRMDIHSFTFSLFFSFLTIVWIVAGGVGQIGRVIYLYFRGDRLDFLGRPLVIVLVIATIFLQGPTVLYLYGAIYLVQNRKSEDAMATAEK